MIERRPGGVLVHVGIGLFVTGVLLMLVTVVPFFFGASGQPLWLHLACLSTPAGLGLTLTGLARGTRDMRRRVCPVDGAAATEDIVAATFARPS